MKWLWMLLLAGTVGSLRAQYSLPEGFIVYSKGNDSQRTLYRVDVHPGDTPEQIAATERKICDKGVIGGDIEGQISFDGKWLAFARTVAKTTKGKGNNDYHDYDKWEIYVVRIDGTLPAEPIRIGPGYFPSWSDDSDQEVKTLYYTYEKERCIRRVTIDDRGKVLKEGVLGVLPSEGYEGCTFAAPDGTYAAFRKNGMVSTYFFSGPLAGKDVRLSAGCHPHITADSKWVYHASRNAVRNDGSARGSAGAGGHYHYGSSADMHWFVTKRTGDSNNQNQGGEVWLCPLYTTDTRFETDAFMKICDDGSWVDIHVYPTAKNKKIAAKNTKILKEKSK